jgi:HD-GYP domain-containing protein (c-di-GMP phosphodiesterase class II)
LGRPADSATRDGRVSGSRTVRSCGGEAGDFGVSPERGTAALPAIVNPTTVILKRRSAPIEALFARAAANDSGFRSHALRVAALSVQVGRALGLRRHELRNLELAAKLHDVGKLIVPRSILAKPGPLDDEEWTAMRRHPAEGARLLAPHVRARDVIAIVRSHHERWDGAGYPDGLHGEEIPLGARIVTPVDAFCAMIDSRPYRPPLDAAAARAELLAQAGRQFDPECAEQVHRITGLSV